MQGDGQEEKHHRTPPPRPGGRAPFQPPCPHFHLCCKIAPSNHPGTCQVLSLGRELGTSPNVAEGWGRGHAPVPVCQRCGAVTPWWGARQPPRPRGRAPLCRQLEPWVPRALELPKTPGDSSPGTLPLLGTSSSLPLSSHPAGFAHAGHARDKSRPPAAEPGSGGLSRRAPVRAPRAPWSCRPAMAAARTVRAGRAETRGAA